MLSNIYEFNGKDITMTMCIVIRAVIRIIASRQGCTFADAMYDFYHSQTLKILQNTQTALWAEAPEYIADMYFMERSASEAV